MHDEENNEAQIAALLRMAGRRPQVPADAAARVREAVHEEWLRTTRRRTRNRVLMAIAAAALIAVFGVLLTRRPHFVPPTPNAAPQLVATAQVVSGSVVARDPDPRVLGEASPIYMGASVETAAGSAAAFEWQGRASLRLAGGTLVHFHTPDVLTLERGAVYFSSTKPGRPIAIRTPRGDVRDIGTQFEVRVEGGDVRVRVREGKVELGREVAEAGIELNANANGITRRAIDTSGADWDWILAAAPPIALDGTLAEVLGRVAREKGLTLRFADERLRTLTLHGNVPLTPDDALGDAVQAAGVRVKVRNGEMVVSR